MVDNKLSGAHVVRTLAYLTISEYRNIYLSSFHTDKQRNWAIGLLKDYSKGKLTNFDLVPGQDSVCQRCYSFRQLECVYDVEPLIFGKKEFPFGLTKILDLLDYFDPKEFLKKELENQTNFYQNLMQHM